MPAFGGKVSEAVSRQSGYRMPQSVKKTSSPSWVCLLAVLDYEAALTAPGGQLVGQVSGYKKSMSPAEGGAVLLGMLFKMRFGDCTRDPEATEELASNMMRFSVSYKSEHGIKRSSPRLCRGVPRVLRIHPYRGHHSGLHGNRRNAPSGRVSPRIILEFASYFPLCLHFRFPPYRMMCPSNSRVLRKDAMFAEKS